MASPTSRAIAGAIAALVLAACGGEDAAPAAAHAPATCPAPARVVGDRCLEPGVQDDGCPAGQLGRGDGTCAPAGIPPDGCADGFEHDGDVGCMAVLPPEACTPGFMAVPGETACRPVAPCGAGKWGDIPVDAATVYVDASYVGAGSDGTAAQPWTTIQEAIDAAPAGALVAVAEGSYVERIRVAGQPVRLSGVCPEKVEIVGNGLGLQGCPPASVCVRGGAEGTEIRGVAISGDATGVYVSGSTRVLFDAVWVHDVGTKGFLVQDGPLSTAATVRASLVEQTPEQGVFIEGATATIEASVVRDTTTGRGIYVASLCPGGGCDPTARAQLTLERSLVEKGHEVGLFASGADVTMSASVVRDTIPRDDGAAGIGLVVQKACDEARCGPSARSVVTMSGSIVERNHEANMLLLGSDGLIETTVFRDALPGAEETLGDGLVVQMDCGEVACDESARAVATVRSSLVASARHAGIVVHGSDATVEGVVIRDTLPQASDLMQGFGLDLGFMCTAATGCDTSARAHATVRGTVVERSHHLGVFVHASDATIEGTVVRDTAPIHADLARGGGISVQYACFLTALCDPTKRASMVLHASIVERHHTVGILVEGSDGTISSSIVRDTLPQPSDGQFGDGIVVMTDDPTTPPATLVATGVRIDTSARAGISNFGGSVELGQSVIQCAAFDLEGEPRFEHPFSFEDLGGNACGCPEAAAGCIAVSAGLAPPGSPTSD